VSPLLGHDDDQGAAVAPAEVEASCGEWVATTSAAPGPDALWCAEMSAEADPVGGLGGRGHDVAEHRQIGVACRAWVAVEGTARATAAALHGQTTALAAVMADTTDQRDHLPRRRSATYLSAPTTTDTTAATARILSQVLRSIGAVPKTDCMAGR